MAPCDDYPCSDWSFRLLSFWFYDSRSRSGQLTTNARPNTDKGPTTEIRLSENFALIVPLASATRLPKSPTWLQMRNKIPYFPIYSPCISSGKAYRGSMNITEPECGIKSILSQHDQNPPTSLSPLPTPRTINTGFPPPPPPVIPRAINTGGSLTEIGLEVLHGKD